MCFFQTCGVSLYNIRLLYISQNCTFIGFTVHCFQTNSYPGVTFFVTQFLVSKARKTRPVHGWVYWWWMYLDDGLDVSFITHSYLEGTIVGITLLLGTRSSVICWAELWRWSLFLNHWLGVQNRVMNKHGIPQLSPTNMCRSLQIDWDKLFSCMSRFDTYLARLQGFFPGVSEELYILLQCPDTVR